MTVSAIAPATESADASEIEEVNRNVADSNRLDVVLAEMRQQYSGELAQALHAGLGVAASLSLKDRDNCLVMIYEGTSGVGKSTVVRMFGPASKSSKTHKVFERVDSFTPASFVSNSSKHTSQELDDIDLLPRLKGKVMLTKELSPLFSDDEKALKKSFGTLTSVLDGNGYVTNSGTQGKRSYDGEFLFNWIGATTPIKPRVHELMSQLGNRILFYEIPSREVSLEELMATGDDVETKGKVMRHRVNDLIEAHFERFAVNSVDPDSVAISEPLLRSLATSARLIVSGRVAITRIKRSNEDDELEVGDKEGPHRVFHLLRMLCKGLALIARRKYVTDADVSIIRHVAMSSLPPKRRSLLRAMQDGEITSTEFAALENITKPTALQRMKELAATGLCVYTPGEKQKPATLTLAKGWEGQI